MLKRQYNALTGEPYLQEIVGIKRKFRRTVSALVWPYSDKKGIVLVLGEILTSPNELGGRRHLHVLAEYEAEGFESLMQEATKAQFRFLCGSVVTPIDDERYVFLEEYNDRQRKNNLSQLRTDAPVFFHGKGEGRMLYYTDLVKRRITEEKTLHFNGKCPITQGDFQKLEFEDYSKKMIEYPAISALSFCVEWFEQNKKMEWGERRKGGHNAIADSLGGY